MINIPIKSFIYNDYELCLYPDGVILFLDDPYECLIIDVGDMPIINELMKELIEYYVEWKKCQKSPF